MNETSEPMAFGAVSTHKPALLSGTDNPGSSSTTTGAEMVPDCFRTTKGQAHLGLANQDSFSGDTVA
jgi:hypothetical protein